VPPRVGTPEELAQPSTAPDSIAEHMIFRPSSKRSITVERTGDHSFRVDGPQVAILVQRFDVTNEDALAHVESRLRSLGVTERLEALGFDPGDELDLAGTVFSLDDYEPEL